MIFRILKEIANIGNIYRRAKRIWHISYKGDIEFLPSNSGFKKISNIYIFIGDIKFSQEFREFMAEFMNERFEISMILGQMEFENRKSFQ